MTSESNHDYVTIWNTVIGKMNRDGECSLVESGTCYDLTTLIRCATKCAPIIKLDVVSVIKVIIEELEKDIVDDEDRMILKELKRWVKFNKGS
jgi:hypothetical protein